MIHLLNVRDIGNVALDETWMIVRSLKKPINGTVQVKELSPSYHLFCEYLRLRSSGIWNERSFKELYVPTFLKEITSSQAAHDRLNELFVKSRRGKNIGLVCFCADEALCHRSIIGGLLSGVGVEVRTTTGSDYGVYYKMYKAQRSG